MGCCKSKKEAEPGVIETSKLMAVTKTGKPINTKVIKQLITKRDQNFLIKKNKINQIEMKLVFLGQYSDFSLIIKSLYLTGIGGITRENITSHQINCMINVTFEVAFFDIEGMQTLRIPVEDDINDTISIYFDEVCDQIQEWILQNMKVVVHCMCGVSRSACIVLAYLMKCKRMSLESAFLYVRQKRPCVNPNQTFFQQLIDYERKLFKKATIKMILHSNKDGKEYLLPDIIVKKFPNEAEIQNTTTIDSTLAPFFMGAQTFIS